MTPTPWSTAAAAATAATAPASLPPTPSPAPDRPVSFFAAVVARYDEPRESLTAAQLASGLQDGKVLVPCEFTFIGLPDISVSMPPATPCVPIGQMTERVRSGTGTLGLLPPGLVSASVKVLSIDGADLFGSPTKRTRSYPLYAQADVVGDWADYRQDDIRTLISTGDTCPDRGVSFMAVTKKQGWDWVLDGSSVRYRGFKTSAWDWPVPILSRTGNAGRVSSLISDYDVSVNDFECPMISTWTQHNTGMVFSIDPASGRCWQAGRRQGRDARLKPHNRRRPRGRPADAQILDAAEIKHTGAGRTLPALAPAIVDADGLKFAFVGWDDISGSGAARSGRPGVAPMTDANVCASIKAARAEADVVFAMPQWGWPEYHATFTKTELTQRQFFADGADDVLGSGTHWASAVSITPGAGGTHFVIGSHGNFLFGQDWSRQTMEGVIVEATFAGTTLVQARLHPYVVLDEAQPNLIDPTTDGATC